MYWIKERHARIAHIKDDQPQWVRAAIIVTRHSHIRRHHLRLAGSYCDWFTPFQFQSERALHNVDGHREPVSMKQSPFTWSEAYRENAHLLFLARRHAGDNLAEK